MKGFNCQCVVNLRNSIKFWWDFLQCGGHGVVGWFNALSAFRPTFNLMASAGRSCSGNNDFFFWFQLQKCPCCVIYWFPLSKAEALWCLDWSFFSFIISCALCQKFKINLRVILLSFDWRTDSWWDVFQWFVPITRPLSVSFLLFTFFLGHNRRGVFVPIS